MRSQRLVTLFALLVSACSPAISPVDAGRRDAPVDARGDAPPADVVPVDTGDPTLRQLESVLINPTDAVLLVDPAAAPHPTQAFTVVGRRRDGTMTDPLTGVWSLIPSGAGGVDPNLLGRIDSSSGLFTASGSAGGEIRVQVGVVSTTGTLMASTSITVLVRGTLLIGTTPSDAPTHFSGTPMTDAARQAGVVYPLEHAVMPQNVYPADIQWTNGVEGDVFRITLRKPHATFIAYLTAPAGFTNNWTVDQAAWRQLAQSDVSDDLAIIVDRFDVATGQVIGSPQVNMRFANGSTAGTIYYWDIVAGQAIRIDDGTATRSTPIPSPPGTIDDVPPSTCMGCHAVSRDGRYFAGRLGGNANNSGVVFDLTADLSGSPAPTLYPVNTVARWSYASFSPDSRRLVTDNYSTSPSPLLRVLDPATGAVVSPNIGLGTQPSWSPDGNTIAFVSSIDTGWGGEFHASHLSLLPVTGSDTYGSPTSIHDGAALAGQAEGGAADSYPSWSPDSHWIAFSHGNVSRSDTGLGALYLIPATPGATPVRLSKASGGDRTTDNFFPNFSPFDTGGYFWLSFLSRRDYGNAQAGTRGTGRQQIWVTAVRRNPDGTTDPSEVAYWLPGQNTQSRNISAFWAPRPCRHDGDACGVNADCCSGICRDDGTGHTTCQPPPGDQCRTAYQPCGGGGCCMGLECIGNVCSPPPG